jgi:hypothetical protein
VLFHHREVGRRNGAVLEVGEARDEFRAVHSHRVTDLERAGVAPLVTV